MAYKRNYLFLGIVFLFLLSTASGWSDYRFSKEPIDVVIPATKKDIISLNDCIRGIKKFGKGIRRVIVISSMKYTDEAEWYDEKGYPFSKMDIACQLNNENAVQGQNYFLEPHSRCGWYYQQLLKLYAPYVIPGISSNVLVLDSDTIFLRPVEFIGKQAAGLFNPGTEYHKVYFEHMARLLPGYKKIYEAHSGISHHMLFQKPVLDDLFSVVENLHQIPFWKAFCQAVDPQHLRASGASEYEIYFNFVFAHSQKVKIRKLNWLNAPPLDILGKEQFKKYRKKGYHYVSCHKYLN